MASQKLSEKQQLRESAPAQHRVSGQKHTAWTDYFSHAGQLLWSAGWAKDHICYRLSTAHSSSRKPQQLISRRKFFLVKQNIHSPAYCIFFPQFFLKRKEITVQIRLPKFRWSKSAHLPDSTPCFWKGGKKRKYVILVLYFRVRVRLITWAKDSFRCSLTFFSWKYLVLKNRSVFNRTIGEYAPSCLHSHKCSSSILENI